jgi:aspartate--ammonia ligase
MKLFFPENYKPKLDLKQTEKAIKLIKDFFQENLSSELRLRRVTAPLFVLKGTGINDDLNGIERPVSFGVKEMNDARAEVVHSLAKWKRLMLAHYGIPVGYGIYTDMNAIRPDEELTNIHSLYVDQWDWEKVITAKQREIDYLKKVVNQIYAVLLRTEFVVYENYPSIKPMLPEEITFVYAEELAQRYPKLTPKEREHEITKSCGAVFIIGIGGKLTNGEPHDGRAPDYDDWTTPNSGGYFGLNGDILIWNPVLQQSLEISSMGIRVDKAALLRQLEIAGANDRKDLMFHKKLLKDELPLSIGGGIGQSRLCMYFLRKAHIGEVQASLWPEEMVEQCAEHNIYMV